MKKHSGKKTACFFIEALGCPKNLVESEVISGSLLTRGYTISFDPDEADIYIIATCGFLPAARNEAAESISSGCEWKSARKGRKLIVAGCLLNHPDIGTFKKHFSGVDLWVPVNDTARLPELLDA